MQEEDILNNLDQRLLNYLWSMTIYIKVNTVICIMLIYKLERILDMLNIF